MKERIDSIIPKYNRRLRYDFLPPMLEIIERPANPIGTILIWLIILISVTTFLWAYFLKIDVAVTAMGYVNPKDKMITIKSAGSGLVEEVYVGDADWVKQGDAILSIEQNQQNIQLEDYKYNLEILRVQYEVYSKIQEGIEPDEIDSDSYRMHANIVKAIVEETKLYNLQKKEYERLAAISAENNNAKETFVQEHELSLIQNLNSLEIKIHDTESSIKKLQKQIDESVVKTPTDGKVTQLNNNLRGSVLQAGDTICYIIPDNSTMQFECYVSDRDIKDVHIGDSVKVKLLFYKDTEDEIINGTVTKISDVAVSSQNMGNCYLVDIELEKTAGLEEHIGTEGTCDILVGTRSVFDYFTEPFIKGLKDSLKER